MRCFIYFFNEGVRSGGGIGDLLEIKNWENKNIFFFRFLFDLVFFLSVILILLNMINGIIVTQYSEFRQRYDKNLQDKQNKCYICSIDRSEFEKRKISFYHHTNNDHNIKDYINYILHLKLRKNKDLNYNELLIKKSILARNIYLFPIYRSKSLGEMLFNPISEENI